LQNKEPSTVNLLATYKKPYNMSGSLKDVLHEQI